ncbi:radical SAM protein [Xanthovirga aplysinae]|uniref:radical SAM protein n=1 Tax=Xanthovirga aplysinae TaxID=2529853 RepID=UPI0012BC01CF|nr:radical SAM protein [Xanthovirga aplysinae]MTI31797.1 radical SAM protein [Xanthovirga aplysinae]
MPTFLFDDVVFGPVQSRRLGTSLGINLISPTAKICNFDCIYCECGWTDKGNTPIKFVEKSDTLRKLEDKLKATANKLQFIDYITFAGNGEPTLHPQFEKIIVEVSALRNKWMPKAKIAVLSNATTLKKESVLRALEEVDERILKLDAGTEQTFQLLNKPLGRMSLSKIYDDLKSGLFNGDFKIQSMFLKGTVNGKSVDNTLDSELKEWTEKLIEIKPKEVMLYSIDRDTPVDTLERVSKLDLKRIAYTLDGLGISSTISV